jgi:hypothetical protein
MSILKRAPRVLDATANEQRSRRSHSHETAQKEGGKKEKVSAIQSWAIVAPGQGVDAASNGSGARWSPRSNAHWVAEFSRSKKV